MTLSGEVTVAAVQAAPVLLDREATLAVLVRHVEEAAAAGASLVVFPEAVLPGYPDFVWRTRPWSDGAWYERLFDQAVDVPGPAIARLGEAARAAAAWVAVGVVERGASGTLYNSLVHLAPDGTVAAVHRKLVATGGERTVFGSGSSVSTVDTAFGRVGGLICWENLMPLARAALYERGVEVYLAPTWDNSDSWVSTLRHVAREGRCFVIGVTACLRGSDVPRTVPGADEIYGGDDDWLSRGNTAIVAPDGRLLAGPLTGEPGMLVATLDLGELRRARREFDVVGHYARPDVFEFAVRTG